MAGKPGRRGWGYVRRLPNKSRRWQASYVGPDLMRHYAPHTFTAKMDAEEWLAKERRLIERDEWTPPAQRAAERKAKSITLGAYFPDWLENRHNRRGEPLRPRTRLHYQSAFTKHIEPAFGKTPIKFITEDAVNAWRAKLLPDKPTMRAHTYSLMHAIMASAVRDGHLTANPCTNTGALKADRARDPVILTVPEVAQLADEIRPERFKAFVLIAAWCGLRFGEVTELRRGDIGRGAETITVARGVTHRGGCHISTPKSGKGRVVSVPPHIRGDIEHHLKTHVGSSEDALLFPPARGGCHINDKVFRDSFTPAVKAIGREGVRVHDMRHFAGTQAARVGNLVETMGRLGHSTVGASLIYQQIASGRDAEVAEALSRLAQE